MTNKGCNLSWPVELCQGKPMCDVTAGFSVERESVLSYKQEAIASGSFKSLIWELVSQAIVSCCSPTTALTRYNCTLTYLMGR